MNRHRKLVHPPLLLNRNGLRKAPQFILPGMSKKSPYGDSSHSGPRRLSCPDDDVRQGRPRASSDISTFQAAPTKQKNLSISEIAINITPAQDKLSPVSLSESCSLVNLSEDVDIPGGRRHRSKQTHARRLCISIDRLCKNASSSISRSLENIRTRLSPSNSMSEIIKLPDGRECFIEFDILHLGKRPRRVKDYHFVVPQHNFTSLLKIEPLCNSKFKAVLSLDHFPKDKDIIVYIRNSKLDIFLQSKCKTQSHAKRVPEHYAVLHLPNYVDNATLDVEETHNALTFQATLKHFLRRRSLSSEDVRRLRQERAARSPINRKQKTDDKCTSVQSPAVTPASSPSENKTPLFRTRSNTR